MARTGLRRAFHAASSMSNLERNLGGAVGISREYDTCYVSDHILPGQIAYDLFLQVTEWPFVT